LCHGARRHFSGICSIRASNVEAGKSDLASTLDDAMVDLSEYHSARLYRFLAFRAHQEFPVDAEQAAFIAELDLAESDLPGIVRFSVLEAGLLAANDNMHRFRRTE
jgi:hypothetical protein